jgi:hypothetical protein
VGTKGACKLNSAMINLCSYFQIYILTLASLAYRFYNNQPAAFSRITYFFILTFFFKPINLIIVWETIKTCLLPLK